MTENKEDGMSWFMKLVIGAIVTTVISTIAVKYLGNGTSNTNTTQQAPANNTGGLKGKAH